MSDRYRTDAEHWKKTFDYVLKTCPETSYWEIQPPIKFVNGEEALDGNPILFAICDERMLAVRIIQRDHDGDTKVEHWEGTFGVNDEYAELVLSLPMDEEAVLDAISLMREWIRRDHATAKRAH